MSTPYDTPRYSIHAGSSVPSVPAQFIPSEGFAQRLRGFSARTHDVSRGQVIRLIGEFDRYTATLRERIDAALPALREQLARLKADDESPNNQLDLMDRTLDQLERLRRSPAASALEDTEKDEAIGNYIVRNAEHYPQAKKPSNPREVLRLQLKSILNDTEPSLEKEQSSCRRALESLVRAQYDISEDVAAISEYLDAGQTKLRNNQSEPSAIGQWRQHMLDSLQKLHQAAERFSGLLEWHLDRLAAPAVTTQGPLRGR